MALSKVDHLRAQAVEYRRLARDRSGYEASDLLRLANAYDELANEVIATRQFLPAAHGGQ